MDSSLDVDFLFIHRCAVIVTPKKATAFRLSADDLKYLDTLAARFGVTRTDIVRLSVRRMAEAEGMSLAKPKPARRTTKAAS